MTALSNTNRSHDARGETPDRPERVHMHTWTLVRIACACTVLCLWLCPATLRAQDEQEYDSAQTDERVVPHDPGYATIHVLARAAGDSVVLRWAPDTPHGWRLGNRIGYTIERSGGGGGRTQLTSEPVIAWHPERVEPMLRVEGASTMLTVAVIAAWGDSTLAGVADSLGFDTLDSRAERNTMMHGFALFAADNEPFVATVLGLRFVDRGLTPGVEYTYTVSLAGTRSYRIDAGSVTVRAGSAPAAGPPPRDLTANGRDGSIELRWLPNAGATYSGYQVFRSADRGRTFTRLTAVPRIILETNSALPARGGFTDTTIVNGRTYLYRVYGVDAFGVAGAYAEVEATGVDLTPPPAPVVKNPEQTSAGKILLRWDMEDPPRDLAGFHILRSRASDSGFMRITSRPLPAAARSYVDEKPDDATPFYVVSAVDAAGNEAQSVCIFGTVLDTSRPPSPAGLAGSIDTNGIVRLHWRPVRGARIIGYRVLRANAPDHEFTMLTGMVHPDTSYTDSITLNTLTRTVYYRVESVAQSYRPSTPSSVLELVRPDIVPPSAPVFTGSLLTERSVRLAWAPSSSDDVSEQVVLRSSERDESWRVIARLAPDIAHFTDTAVEPRVMYYYHVEAVDAAGLRARTAVHVSARPYDTGVRPTVSALRAVRDTATGAITLHWREPQIRESFSIVIFRADGAAPISPYASLRSGSGIYVDTYVGSAATYTYRLKVLTERGGESVLSEPVTVRARNE